MQKITLSIFTAGLLLSPAFGAQDLGEVVVTSSSKVPQKIKETTQNVTIVTAEDIEEKGYQSVPEVLAHTAGFVVSSNGGAGQTTSIFVRGLSSDNILVLVDGVPLTDYTMPTSAASLEHISIDSIEKIEIIKGGQSGIWGLNSVAGTVNIVTKGGTKKDRTSISFKLGSHATTGVGFDLSKNFNGNLIALGLHWLKTDGISALSPKSAEKDGYKNLNYYINGEFKIDKSNSISLFAKVYDGKFDYDSSYNANDKSSYGRSKQKIYGIDYKYQNGPLTINSKIVQRKIDRNYTTANSTFDTVGESIKFSLTSNYRFSDKNSLTFGVEHNIDKAKTVSNSSFGKTITKDKFKNSAVFASYNHKVESILGADTIFNSVIRYDKYNKFDNKWTYRFGIKRECKAIDGLHTYVNIYKGYKAPTLYEFTNAADKLNPESSKGYDISIGYKKYINVTYFNNKIENKILSNPTTWKYYNSKNSIKTKGIEISSEYAFGDSGFVLGATWTHMLKYKDSSGKKAQRIPKNSASLYLDYYFGENSHIGLVANYIGKRRDIDYSVYPAKDVTLKSYTTVDLTYNRAFSNNLKLNVTVKNIFDKKYQTVYNYNTEGRSLYATVEYKF